MRLRGRISGPAQSRQRCGTKISGHGEPLFSETENRLALVTMTCQLLTRIADGS